MGKASTYATLQLKARNGQAFKHSMSPAV